MTDESMPLSRRERRARAARAAARPAEDTDALGDMPISESIPTHSPEGRVLTRRERRRLERARQPIETWTAEEEMIATGQIPAMTPERIAEQERIAREKAEAAQREARTASSEFAVREPSEQASAPSVDSATSEEPADAAVALPTDAGLDDGNGESEPGPEAWHAPATDDAAGEPTVPQRTSLIPSPAEPAESDEDAAPVENAAPVEDATPVENDARGDQDEVSQHDEPSYNAVAIEDAPVAEHPVPQLDAEQQVSDEPAEDEQVSDEPAEDEAPVPAVTAVPGMPPGMSLEMFAALFPPGSLQRRLMEQQAAEQQPVDEPDEPALEDPADEIRRLSQQAVAGIDAVSVPAASSAPDDEDPAAESAAGAVLPNAWGPAAEAAGPSSEAVGSSSPAPARDLPQDWMPQADEPSPQSAASTPSAPSTPAPESQSEAVSQDEPAPDPDVQTPPTVPSVVDDEPAHGTAALDRTPFDAILGHHPGTAALDEASQGAPESRRPAFHSVAAPSVQRTGSNAEDGSEQLTPHYAAFDVPQGSSAADPADSLWSAHPLMQVERVAPELPEVEAAQNIPQPDLSSVRRPAFAPLQGDMSSIEPVPTGQIEVPPRERPDLEAEDAPRQFKWAHLAVFGAVAFLLGVVVWNAALKP